MQTALQMPAPIALSLVWVRSRKSAIEPDTFAPQGQTQQEGQGSCSVNCNGSPVPALHLHARLWSAAPFLVAAGPASPVRECDPGSSFAAPELHC